MLNIHIFAAVSGHKLQQVKNVNTILKMFILNFNKKFLNLVITFANIKYLMLHNDLDIIDWIFM